MRDSAAFVAAAAAILALALALRLYGAAGQSLWYDEGTSVALASRPPLEILRSAARDIHPPLYYLALSAWTRLAGDGIGAIRGLSALIGVAAVAGVIGLGRFLWRREAGLAAGMCAALSPYLVWYSQEVRSYILVAALVPPLVYAAVSATAGKRSGRWWAAVAILVAATLYTHYFCGLAAVMAANVAFALAALRRRDDARTRPAVSRWIVVQLVAALAFVPWLAYARQSILSWPATSEAIAPSVIALESLILMSVGAGPRIVALAGVLAFWSLIGLVGYRRGLLGGSTGVIPLAIALSAPAGLVLLSLSRPAWNAKFLVSSAPGLELLVGGGITALALVVVRVLGAGSAARAAGLIVLAAGLATVLVPRARVIAALANDPAYARDDYRGLAAFVGQAATPDDAVILDAPTQVEVFGYYDRSGLARFPLPDSRPADAARTLARLAQIASAHGDIYGVLWAEAESDPEHIVETWLNQNRAKAFDRWYGGIRLAAWGNTDQVEATGIRARFGEAIGLDGVAVTSRQVAPGDIVGIEAVWQPIGTPGADYVVFAQLLDESGQLAVGRDFAPQGGSVHTSQWTAATSPVVDRIGLEIPLGLAPGSYELILGLYDPATGARLISSRDDGTGEQGADYLELGRVDIGDR